MYRVLLNNSLLPLSEHSDVDKATISIRRATENGRPTFGFSENIQFYGAAFALLRATLVEDPNAKQNKVDIDIYDDCCGQGVIYRGEITAESIDWCLYTDGHKSYCSINGDSKERLAEIKAIKCVRETLINNTKHAYPSGETFWYVGMSGRHPYIRYCNDLRPRALRIAILIMLMILTIVDWILFPIFLIWSLLVSLINVICDIPLIGCDGIDADPDQPGQQNGLDFLQSFFGQWLPRLFTGCGDGHPSPLVRDYAWNVCLPCGLQFSSSILADPNSEYYNAAYFHAPNMEGEIDYIYPDGTINANALRQYFELNAPDKTGGEFLDELAELFRAQWYVQGNTLFFERQPAVAPVWIDFTTAENTVRIKSLCYEYKSDAFPRVEKFTYQIDSLDSVGNEARWLYNDIVDYDPAGNYPALEGVKNNQYQFGASRFRGDGITPDPLETFSGALSFVSGILWFFSLGASINLGDFIEELLLVQQGKTLYSKIIILRPNYEVNNAKAVFEFVGGRKIYNRPMWFAACWYGVQYADDPTSEKICAGENMFGFVADKVPIVAGAPKGLSFKIEFKRTCEDLASLMQIANTTATSFNMRLVLPADNSGGTIIGFIEEITFGPDTISISGVV